MPWVEITEQEKQDRKKKETRQEWVYTGIMLVVAVPFFLLAVFLSDSIYLQQTSSLEKVLYVLLFSVLFTLVLSYLKKTYRKHKRGIYVMCPACGKVYKDTHLVTNRCLCGVVVKPKRDFRRVDTDEDP